MCYTRKTIAHHYNGGFAEYVLVPAGAVRAGNVNRIPDEVTYLEASLAEPLACVLNAQEVMGIALGNSVAVLGAGPIGLMHAELARGRGDASRTRGWYLSGFGGCGAADATREKNLHA
jgi:L-iditol 2-dehydrogenase